MVLFSLVIVLFIPVGILSACSSQVDSSDRIITAAMSFVENYDVWAQSGYSSPIPGMLLNAVSSDMLAILEDDQDWYLTGGVRQHGSVKIVDAELVDSSDDKAIVSVTLDASEVTVTAEGEQTYVDYSYPIITRVHLERAESWIVVSTDSREDRD